KAFRQQRRLLAIHPLNETPHQFPPRFSKRIIASTEFLHSLGQRRVSMITWRKSGSPIPPNLGAFRASSAGANSRVEALSKPTMP
ncbi:hypothetical protein, partial [Bradyrhizobium sp. SSUT77]|uniref:hypothetical protein n=1 Tax=Bradyrhizobium sp. SSUT77 TaxID=3040603 RepID=UPI00244AAC15